MPLSSHMLRSNHPPFKLMNHATATNEGALLKDKNMSLKCLAVVHQC